MTAANCTLGSCRDAYEAVKSQSPRLYIATKCKCSHLASWCTHFVVTTAAVDRHCLLYCLLRPSTVCYLDTDTIALLYVLFQRCTHTAELRHAGVKWLIACHHAVYWYAIIFTLATGPFGWFLSFSRALLALCQLRRSNIHIKRALTLSSWRTLFCLTVTAWRVSVLEVTTVTSPRGSIAEQFA